MIHITDKAYNVLLEIGPKKSGTIFPYNFKSVARKFRDIFKELKLHNLQFRDFRRTAITEMALSGLSLPEVAVISRHRDLNVLQRLYVQVKALHVANKLKRLQPNGKKKLNKLSKAETSNKTNESNVYQIVDYRKA